MFYHGSHLQHPMQTLVHPRVGVLCSICRACAHPSLTGWSVCTQEGCGYILCWKCVEIEEQMFDTPQVITRNPVLAHDDMSVCLRTRPRGNAHALCPLYPARLMTAVSSARGKVDPTETYYRMKTGGWVNAAHVVRVLPSQQLIEELAKAHLAVGEFGLDKLMSLDNLLFCIEESFRLMDEHSPYGPIMASLIFFPLLQYSSSMHLISAEERITFVRASLGFIHYLFHFVLDEVNNWLDTMDYKVKTTVLTLYVELLGKSLLIARDVAESQIVPLPVELCPLVTRTAAVSVTFMQMLECGRLQCGGTAMTTSMRAPSVVSRQVEFAEEQARLFMCCCNMVETAGWLLLHTSSFTYNLKDLHPLRVAVSIVSNSESLERMLCQVATGALERMPSLQRKIHDLDVLEVAVSLMGRATCAESQMAVFKLISAISRKSPRNIAQLSSVVIAPLIQLAMKAWNTVVANAAFDCFAELAYNDPRVNGSRLEPDGKDTLMLAMCSASLHPGGPPYQMMYVYDSGEQRQAICEYCRHTHPPKNSILVGEPQFAYFSCQCACCLHERAARPLPPPDVPPTAAISAMMKGGVMRVMLFWLKCSESAVANAVGRLALKISVSEEVTLALYRALLRQDIAGYTDAALAVAARRHLPAVQEMSREYPHAAISRYLRGRGRGRGDAAGAAALAEQTPGKTSDYGDFEDPDGLSPSPDVPTNKTAACASFLPGGFPPLIDLFTKSRKTYLDDTP